MWKMEEEERGVEREEGTKWGNVSPSAAVSRRCLCV